MRLTARIVALVVGEAGALLALRNAFLTVFGVLGSLLFGDGLPATFSIVVDGSLLLFSLLAFAASIVVLVYPRAMYLLAASTLGVLAFGYLQLPAVPLPEPVAPPQIPL